MNNTQQKEKLINMANEATLEDFLNLLADKIADRLNGVAEDAAPVKSKGKAKPSKAVEPEDDDADDADEGDADEYRAELTKKRVTSLRKMAIEAGYAEDEVEDADKDTLVVSLVGEKFPDEGDEDDADDAADDDADDDDGDDEDAYSREDYDAMSLAEVKAIAKDAGYSTADLKGMDQDAITDMLLEEEDPEDDDDGDDADDADDDDEGYTEDDLEAMNLRELKALAKEYNIKVVAGMKKPALIKKILA